MKQKKIAWVQGEYGGAQVTGYPIPLQVLPLLNRMIQDGYQIDQVYPSYKKGGLIQKWFKDPVLRKEKLQEHFNLGVIPVDVNDAEFNPKDYDRVLMWACPWDGRNTYLLIETLQKFTDAGVPLTYIHSDLDLDLKKGSTSVFFQILPKENPDIFKNIRQYITCFPTYVDRIREIVDKDVIVEYIPTTYGKEYEIPIKSLSEKEFVFRFPGPVGVRKRLFDSLDKFVGLNGLPSEFWNESTKEMKKARSNTPQNPYQKYKDNPLVQFHEEGLFLPYPQFIEFGSTALFGFMDSTVLERGVDETNNHHTSRVNNNLYSGIISLTTGSKSMSDVMDPEIYRSMRMDLLSKDELLDMIKDDNSYKKIVESQRVEMDKRFGIQHWIQKYYDIWENYN